MATTVDMSLDDIIKSNRGKGRGRGGVARRGRGTGRPFNGGKMTGPVRKGPFGVNTRATQFAISKGSAEVVYMRRSDAFSALKKYNNVLLDGKPMKIEIVGANTDAVPISARVNVTGVNGRPKRTVVMTYVKTSSINLNHPRNSF
ncbi:THO complex subunit 4C [Linum perenne]